jgi:hypothetical protein
MAAGRAEVTHAVIRNLYKLMAYKDEYEVARLHLKPAFHAGTRALFAAPRRVTWHLHPPLSARSASSGSCGSAPGSGTRSGRCGRSGGSGGRRTIRSATPPSAARSAASCPGTATS